jgi:NAD(P)-dependent dehydrogenase (short-subunit alcohol dehydrogenase family)
MAANYPELKGKVASEGVRVIVSDIGAPAGPNMPASAIGASDEMNAVVDGIRQAGGEAAAVACNVLDPASVQALVDKTVARYGGVDILVNNAGIGYLMKSILDLSVEEWDTTLGVNLRGVFLATQAAARQMVAQGRGGRIVNIASQAAKSGFPHASAYVSSKHGVMGLTRVSAIEFGPQGITANAICPNHVTTGLGAWQNEYFSKLLGKTVEQYLDDMRNRIPLRRPGLVSDTADACAFLCSDQARYITGEAMNVSGGEEMH